MKLVKIVLILVGLTIQFLMFAKSIDAQISQEWFHIYETSSQNSMVIDDSENVFVTGRTGNTVDSLNYATIKYNKYGIVQWVSIFNGSDNKWDESKAIAVDDNGNVYVTGISFALKTGFDYLTIKYNSSGVEQWEKRYNGPYGYQDYAVSVKVDKQGNVYVSGYSRGIGTDYDFLTIKYTFSGDLLWSKRYNGSGNGYDKVVSMVLDDSGNAYVTGYSNEAKPLYDYLTIKYNSTGTEEWVARYHSTNSSKEISIARASAIAIDNFQNTYITGSCIHSTTNSDYETIKYNSSGMLQWVAVYDGNFDNDMPTSIAVDASGNVCVTGISNYDYATVMYDTNGIQKWVARYFGDGIYDEAYAVALDLNGNVYVTGGASANPNPYKYTTLKYNNNGVQQWLEIFPTIDNNASANSISIGKNGNVYVSGNYRNGFLTIKYSQTTGIDPQYFSTVNQYELLQNFPNPFNPSTVIKFELPADEIVNLRIYDTYGRELKTLVNGKLSKGNHEFTFSGDGLSSGIYFYKLESENFSQTKKMLLIK